VHNEPITDHGKTQKNSSHHMEKTEAGIKDRRNNVLRRDSCV